MPKINAKQNIYIFLFLLNSSFGAEEESCLRFEQLLHTEDITQSRRQCWLSDSSTACDLLFFPENKTVLVWDPVFGASH